MKTKLILLLFLLPLLCKGQNLKDSDLRYSKDKVKIEDFINKQSKIEKNQGLIVYSIFNHEYYWVIRKLDSCFDEYFIQLESDNLPVILYDSTISSSDIRYKTLFDRNKYWKVGRIFYDHGYYNRKEGEVYYWDYNKSDFFFYDENGKVVAEFHLPTYNSKDPSPLEKNHYFFLEKRKALIMKYIFSIR